MPNIATMLKDEIARISRREIRKQVEPVRKASAAHRREIAALKRDLAAARRLAADLSKRAASAARTPEPASDERPARFQARGLRSLRARLGVSQAQLAKLLKVSQLTVYNWEAGKSAPRKERLAEIVALRGLGKREVQQRLAELKPAKAKRRRK